jgi:hypothetical protein
MAASRKPLIPLPRKIVTPGINKLRAAKFPGKNLPHGTLATLQAAVPFPSFSNGQ